MAVRVLQRFAEVGGDSAVWHLESPPDPRPVLQLVRKLGMRAGLAINPETPFEAAVPYLEEIDVLNVMNAKDSMYTTAWNTDGSR